MDAFYVAFIKELPLVGGRTVPEIIADDFNLILFDRYFVKSHIVNFDSTAAGLVLGRNDSD